MLTLESTDEFSPAIENEESEERSIRGLGIRRLSQPVRPTSYTPGVQPQSRFVTQSQLRDALARVSRDVAANKTAIESVTRQANNAVQRLGQVSSRLDTEVKAIRGELQRQTSNALLLTILTSGSQKVTNKAGETIGTTSPNDMLPFVLILSSGGLTQSSGTGAQAGGADNTMMLALAVMMMTKDKDK